MKKMFITSLILFFALAMVVGCAEEEGSIDVVSNKSNTWDSAKWDQSLWGD